MTKTSERAARSEYVALARSLQLPSAERFKKIASELALSDGQAADLERRVTASVEMLRQFAEVQSEIPEREVRLDRASAILQLLKKLEAELSKGASTLQHIAPPENLGLFGTLLSFQAFAEIAPDIAFEEGLNDFVLANSGLGAELSFIDIEHRFQQPKQMYDLKNRPEVLMFLVRKMREQFDFWLQDAKGNKGGAPANFARDTIIRDLAFDAKRILGRPATATAGGGFVALCAAVFQAVSISEDGLEDAVQRLLRRYGPDLAKWNAEP